MRLLWLPDVLRKAGLTVHEYAGWKSRGYSDFGADASVGPRQLMGVICHATAGSRSSTDAGETRVLWVTGSLSAPAPIAQLYLSRSGEWWVGASGRCNHVAFSQVRPTSPLAGAGNSQLIGIEAANDNRGEPWPAVQLDSYQRGVAAICRYMGWEAWRVLGHAEHQFGRANNEPCGIDMSAFRAAVARLIEEDDMPSEREIWNHRIPPEASVGRSYPGIRDDGYRAGTWVQYGYRWARRAAERAAELLAGQAAILARLDGGDDGAIRQAIREELAAHRELLVDELTDIVDSDGDPAAVVAAVRELLGRVRVTIDPEDG